MIAYPDELLDDKILDDYHEDLVIDPKSYFSTKVNIKKFLSSKKFKSFGQPVNKSDWTEEFGKSVINPMARHFRESNSFSLYNFLMKPIFTIRY